MPESAASTTFATGRLMLVHAHPDDETSTTGATMAAYAAAGAQVTLVTCTLGEEGEVLVDDLSHLASANDDALGDHRLGELTTAMELLGVTDHVRLGGDHRFRDSGMAYAADGSVTPTADPRQECFWRTDLLVAADELVTLIRDRRPHVMITYNQMGGYGHPDHIQAHRVATYAMQLAATRSYRPELPAWRVDRLLWTAWSVAGFRSMIRRARENGDAEFFGGLDPDGEMPPMVLADELIDCEVDGAAYGEAKIRALAAHASQVEMGSGFFAHLSSGHEWGREQYVLGAGTPFPDAGPSEPGRPARDVFAGIDPTRG